MSTHLTIVAMLTSPGRDMRIFIDEPGGPFATLTLATTILVGTLLSAAAAAVVLLIASLLALGILLARTVLPGLRRRSGSRGPDGASWPVDTRAPFEPLAAMVRWPVPPVATPYRPLNTYLEHRHAWNVVLTFEQIESLLGFALPSPARTDREWWTAPADHTDGHAETWTVAGRTAIPNLPAHTVAFTRSRSQSPRKEPQCLHHDGAGL